MGRCYLPLASTISPTIHVYISDFVYCNSVLGQEFIRIDNFSPEVLNPMYWSWSPTTVAHLPQCQFERILKDHLLAITSSSSAQSSHLSSSFYFGYDALVREASNRLSLDLTPATATVPAVVGISCDFLVAADGAHSRIRKFLGIPMRGKERLQTLLNVHFRVSGLCRRLHPRPAMLYFVYNEVVSSIFNYH